MRLGRELNAQDRRHHSVARLSHRDVLYVASTADKTVLAIFGAASATERDEGSRIGQAKRPVSPYRSKN
ncbi:hypothetical protein OKW43_000849 [Paraburkholderia sp. WC7.3g]